MAVLNGTILVVNFGGTAIACSTSCSLSMNQEVIDANCKDSGVWATSIEGRKSWSISCSGLYQITATPGFLAISALIEEAGANTVELVFTDGTNSWTGDAQLASATATGDDMAVATWDAEFTGVGALVLTP